MSELVSSVLIVFALAACGTQASDKIGVAECDAYEAKMARRGVRVADLLREDRVRPLLEQNLAEVNPYVERLGGKPYELDALVTEALELGEKLSRYVADTSRFTYDAIRRGESVLCEGAQGALLDVDHGTYPFVTSSSTSPRPTRRASAPGLSPPSSTARRATSCARRAASTARPPVVPVAAAGSICRRCASRCA